MGFNSAFKGLDLMKIRPEGADLFHADGYTDRRKNGHAEASSRSSQFCDRA